MTFAMHRIIEAMCGDVTAVFTGNATGVHDHIIHFVRNTARYAFTRRAISCDSSTPWMVTDFIVDDIHIGLFAVVAKIRTEMMDSCEVFVDIIRIKHLKGNWLHGRYVALA